MYTLIRKTTNPGAENLLLKAKEENIKLSFDRYEEQMPQCGFGRTLTCCTDCFRGPCRINPLEKKGETICGKTFTTEILNQYGKKILEATRVKAGQYLSQGGLLNQKTLSFLFEQNIPKHRLHIFSSLSLYPLDPMRELFMELKNQKREALLSQILKLSLIHFALEAAIASNAWEDITGWPEEEPLGFGLLEEDQVNILLHGYLPHSFLERLIKGSEHLTEEARKLGAKKGIGFFAVSGNVPHGSQKVSILSDVTEDELPFLSGLIDGIILGEGCIDAHLYNLAQKFSVDIFHLDEKKNLEEALLGMVRHLLKRDKLGMKPSGKVEKITFARHLISKKREKAQEVGALLQKKEIKGLALLEGCTRLKGRGETMKKVLHGLLEERYLVFTGGCAGTALGEMGFFKPENISYYQGEKEKIPSIWYIGSCSQTPIITSFWKLLGEVTGIDRESFPISFYYPEANRPALLPRVISLFLQGGHITTGEDLFFWSDEGFLKLLQDSYQKQLNASIEVRTYADR